MKVMARVEKAPNGRIYNAVLQDEYDETIIVAHGETRAGAAQGAADILANIAKWFAHEAKKEAPHAH